MHREFLPGIHWIQECSPARPALIDTVTGRGASWYRPGSSLVIPQNSFLFVGERALLFDTLSPASGELILADLDQILGSRGLDYLVVSHPDVPHAGNTRRILKRYPEAQLVAPAVGDTHALYHLEDSMKVAPGDEIDLGGHIVRFHEATFLDAPISTWMTEERTRLLLTVDWMGFPLMDGDCLKFADEIDSPIDADRLYEFHARVLFWFQYVDVAKVQREVDRLWEVFQPAYVAPSHGLVIRRDVKRYFDLMKDVVTRVSETGRIGVL